MALSSRLTARLRSFRDAEEGAATVEFVVGTALAIAMALTVAEAVGSGTQALADRVSALIAGIEFDFSGDDDEEGGGA